MTARALLLSLLMVPSSLAHVLSISNGLLDVKGDRARFELRMPVYETTHVNDNRQMLAAVRFFLRGQEAVRSNETCEERMADGLIVCTLDLRFPREVDRVEVDCQLHTITVPNHVHLLRATRGSDKDQAAFDLSFTRAELRFVPPSSFELLVKHTAAGVMRAAGGAVQILFLFALALAARTRKEWAAIAAAFVAGQVLSALITPRTGWDPPPRFVESAMALTVAYLAVEVLALPDGRFRWLIAGALGVFHGWYFSLFLINSGYPAAPVLAGAAVTEWLIAGLFALGLWRLSRIVPITRAAQALAGLLVIVGLGWFFVRLRNG